MDRLPEPQEVGLPHPEWRDAQGDAFMGLRSSYHSGGRRFHFAQIPTGGGKTGIAAALGSVAPVTYVAATLGLLDQAEREYGFDPIKGRQEYECAHPKRLADWGRRYGEVPTARDCPMDKMSECPHAGDCEYMIQKYRALASKRAACTYRYLALSNLMRRREGILVLDECHETVKEIIALASFTVTNWTVEKWGLPRVPWRQRIGPRGRGDLLDPVARGTFNKWADDAMSVLKRHDPETMEGIKAKRLRDRIRMQVERMQGTEWFIEAGPATITRYIKGKRIRVPGIILRPLSAKPVASKLWGNKEMVLLMSATIGKDPRALAGELGIGDKEWVFHDYPHPIPPGVRPVYDLGMGRLTKKNLDANPGLLTAQAFKIAEFVQSMPPHWRGVVLTSSYKRIDVLRGVLRARLPGRVFEPPEGGVSQRIAAFIEDPRQGLVAVDTIQGWGHGLDLRGDLARFIVVAATHFENPSDPFVRARRKLDGGEKYYWWKAYAGIPQACGRASRGEVKDDGTFLLNVAALADGTCSSPRAKRHYPSWFRPRMWRGEAINDTGA